MIKFKLDQYILFKKAIFSNKLLFFSDLILNLNTYSESAQKSEHIQSNLSLINIYLKKRYFFLVIKLENKVLFFSVLILNLNTGTYSESAKKSEHIRSNLSLINIFLKKSYF